MTGGAGYIGSHTVRLLSSLGDAPVVLDTLEHGHPESVAGAPLIVGSTGDRALVQRILREERIEAVIHFAARKSTAESLVDPTGYFDRNVGDSIALLSAVAAAGIGAFVFSSTCAVYGEPSETPLRETHPTAPINAYGQTKLAIEQALPHVETACGIRSIRLRYFNAAGADPDGQLGEDHLPEIHIIPRTIESIVGGAPLRIFGEDYPTPDGTCLRDYIHVTDLADAHVRALARLQDGAPSASYNLGTGRPSSVKEVIAAVEQVTGRRAVVEQAPRRPGDPAVLFAAAELAHTDLGWTPQRPLETIVADAWRWHAAHPNGYGDRH